MLIVFNYLSKLLKPFFRRVALHSLENGYLGIFEDIKNGGFYKITLEKIGSEIVVKPSGVTESSESFPTVDQVLGSWNK